MHHVADGRRIGRRLHVNHQFARRCERVGGLNREFARIAFVAVRGHQSERHRRPGFGQLWLRLPELLVEAHVATVEMVLAIVDGQLIRLAAEAEAAASDPV